MQKKLNIQNWNRKEHFEFFNTFKDPYFGVVSKFDVTEAYDLSKKTGVSFFALYLHACMKAINAVENFKYRIHGDEVVIHDVVHASATIARPDHTFGFSYIKFSEDVTTFIHNFEKEKERILSTSTLFPPTKEDDCIFCSALPWIRFSGHKEPVTGEKESVPKIGFSKVEILDKKVFMNVSISVNHALMDGYHIGLFVDRFQEFLNEKVQINSIKETAVSK